MGFNNNGLSLLHIIFKTNWVKHQAERKTFSPGLVCINEYILTEPKPSLRLKNEPEILKGAQDQS